MGHYLGREEPDPPSHLDLVRKVGWLEVRLNAVEAHEAAQFEEIADLAGRLAALEAQGSKQ